MSNQNESGSDLPLNYYSVEFVGECLPPPVSRMLAEHYGYVGLLRTGADLWLRRMVINGSESILQVSANRVDWFGLGMMGRSA